MKTSDQRSLHTEYKIKSTFYDCLKEKPLSQIKVKDVCALAKINRSTFYDHYKDLHDLLDACEEDCLKAMNPYVDVILDATLKKNEKAHLSATQDIIAFMKEKNHQFYALLDTSEGNHFEAHLINYYYDYIAKALHFENTYERYRLLYQIAGSLTLLIKWVQEDYPLSNEDLSKLYTSFFD